MAEQKFVPHTKIKMLQTLSDNPDGLNTKQLIPLLNKKETTVSKDLLMYFRQGLLLRDKNAFNLPDTKHGRYIYRISDMGKKRLSHLRKKFTS